MPPVQTVSVSLSVPKESKEVFDFFSKLVGDIRAKKPVAEIATGSLGELVKAVEGYDQLDDEVKSEHLDDLAAYGAKSLVGALKPVQAS